MKPRDGSVRTGDLLGVFWRSFFIQASWSYDRMQSLGFSFALIPVLRRLYPDREELSRRLADHMEYFNTQPYFASFILGAAARAEEKRATGSGPRTGPAEVKKALMAPLGALGDSFFWGSLKPFAAAVAVAMLLGGAWWAPALFLGLYNAAHLWLRWDLIVIGYRTEGDVVALMSRYNFPRLARVCKIMTLAVAGVIAGTVTAWGPLASPPGALLGALLAGTGLAATLGMIALLRAGASPVKLMLGLAALCLGLVLGGIIGP